MSLSKLCRQAAERFGARPAIEWEGHRVPRPPSQASGAACQRSAPKPAPERLTRRILPSRNRRVDRRLLAVLDAGCDLCPQSISNSLRATLSAVLAEARPRRCSPAQAVRRTLESSSAEWIPAPRSCRSPGLGRYGAGGLRLASPRARRSDAMSLSNFTSRFHKPAPPRGSPAWLRQSITSFAGMWQTFEVPRGRGEPSHFPAFDAFLLTTFTRCAAGTGCLPVGTDLVSSTAPASRVDRGPEGSSFCTAPLPSFRLLLGPVAAAGELPCSALRLLAGESRLPPNGRPRASIVR